MDVMTQISHGRMFTYKATLLATDLNHLHATSDQNIINLAPAEHVKIGIQTEIDLSLDPSLTLLHLLPTSHMEQSHVQG